MANKPHILISNDDGIHALGIKHLVNALKDFAKLTIVAPATEQSAVSLSITVRDPLYIDKIEWDNGMLCHAVNGTPADCVKLGLNVILDSVPDLIVSGINRGSNAGRNILYSGTVAAAIEGVMHDIPSIAFSSHDYHRLPDFQSVEKFIVPIVEHVLNHPLPKGTLLNVNFPAKENGLKGFKLTHNGLQFWSENLDSREHPSDGTLQYWLGAKLSSFEEEEDCDISWLSKGYIAAVPVQVNHLTHRGHVEELKSEFEAIYSSLS